MPWFRVDDTLSSHPKARAAGLAAMGLWAVSGAYAAQYLTEGHVPDWYVNSWPSGKRLANQLVSAGLWSVAPGGFQFHQWDERQPTKEHVEAERVKTRERVAKWRANKPPVTPTVSNGARNGVTNGVGTPSPALPSPTHKEETPLPRKRGSRLPNDWKPTTDDIAWQRAKSIPDDVGRREFEKFGNYWRSKSGSSAVKLDWSGVWRNWLLTAMERQAPTGDVQAKARIAARAADPLASAR